MNGSNGKTVDPRAMMAAVMGEDQAPPVGNPDPPAPQAPQAQKFGLGAIGLDMMPFTPVPFIGRDALWAYVRLGAYGALSLATWKRARTLSYVFAGAAAVSVLTSLSASARQNVNGI